MPKFKCENIPRMIISISDNVKKRGYVRYNPKDCILNFFLRKQGVVRRLQIHFDKEKLYDVDNKCYVDERNCGYVLALKEFFYKKGIPTYWKKVKPKCECRTRYMFFIDLFSEFFEPKEWTWIKQCQIKENGKWKIVPHDVPIDNIDISNETRNATMREMFSVYGVPIKALSELFNLKERRIRKLVEDLRAKYRKIKKSKGLRKIHWERYED